MGRLLFTGGTGVAADGSFRAGVLVEKIVAETVDASGMYRDGEMLGERGSGNFVERSFAATGLEVRA